MMKTKRLNGRAFDAASPRAGGATVIALGAAVTMAGLCAALLAVSMSTGRARVEGRRDQAAFYAANAGLSDAYARISSGQVTVTANQPVSIPGPGAVEQLGTVDYFVDCSQVGPRTIALESTGSDGANQSRLQLVLTSKADGFFQFAAFGAEGVVLDSNAFIDSYDSAYGSYASQIQGGNTYARENGDIGSNADILLKSNTEIHGDAMPGPKGIVDDSAPGTYVSGSMDPLEEEIVLPPIVVPTVASSGPLVGSSDLTLGPGDVRYDSILMMGGTTLTIVGPARIVAQDFKMKSNTNLSFDTSAGEVELYATRDFVLESNSKVHTSSDSALDVTLFLDGNNLTKKPADQLQLGANADFIGAIYAPNAKFSLASNFNIFGSLMCGKLHLSSHGEIHFDEALLYDGYGASEEYETAYWGPLAKP